MTQAAASAIQAGVRLLTNDKRMVEKSWNGVRLPRRLQQEAKMFEVLELRTLSSDCPTQWEGVCGNGTIYVRYRHGELEVYVSETADAATTGKIVFQKRFGSKHDGRMSTETMKECLSGICRFID
jgi:hypothetical protein